MKNSVQKYRVNWIDGMKINKAHFIETENFLLSNLYSGLEVNVNTFNYGLLPADMNRKTSLDYTISVDGTNTIDAVLHSCWAITRNGIPVSIGPNEVKLFDESGNPLKCNHRPEEDEKKWCLTLRIDPYSVIEIGNADREEKPPRKPYTLPKYTLEILPHGKSGSVNLGSHFLTLGELELAGHRIEINQNFIPPCHSVSSHHKLEDYHTKSCHFLNQMESSSLVIIQKVLQKNQTNDLAKMAHFLAVQTINYIAGNQSGFKTYGKHKEPIDFITKLMGLARRMKVSIDMYSGPKKENFLNYLTHWCDLNQGVFENVLNTTIQLEYNHEDIGGSLEKLSAFATLFENLFKKLSELDYIGEKPDTGIFVKEERVQKNVNERKSFLFD